MTVAHYQEPPPLPASQPGDELKAGPTGDVARLRAAAEYAGYIGDTEFVPDSLRGRPAAIAAAILAGTELGLQPMVALRTVAIIRGRPTLTAEAQRGLITGAGHELWFDESTTTRAIAAGRRHGSERIGRITWTLDDAKRAGIVGGEAWRRYPAEMLRARASAALARTMFPDVTLGIPASEELESEGNGLIETPPPTPADTTPPEPTGRKRRRAPAPAPQSPAGAAPLTPTPPPDPQPEPEIPPEPLATDPMRRRIFALMRDVGLETAERDQRLDYTRRVTGRAELTSSNELTVGEASRLISDLEEIAQLPPGDERTRRLLGPLETAVVEEIDKLTRHPDDDIPF